LLGGASAGGVAGRGGAPLGALAPVSPSAAGSFSGATGSASAAGFAPPPASSTASPGSPMIPTGSATGTVAPAGTMCLSRVPAARATSSITALSVSTSASTSPTATDSPSCFFHSMSRPSSMVGESASITTLVAISSAFVVEGARRRGSRFHVEHALHGGDRLGRVRLGGLLQRLVVRHRDVGRRDPEDRRIQLVEDLPLDHVHHLRTDTGKVPPLLQHHAAVGARHRGEQCLGVERADGAEVDHLGL